MNEDYLDTTRETSVVTHGAEDSHGTGSSLFDRFDTKDDTVSEDRNSILNSNGPIHISQRFCPADVADPFDTVTWETRSASIKGDNREVIFEQNNCEIPSEWSALATNVVVSKYFYGEPGTSQREYSVRQLIHRVSRTIADWGLRDGYFATEQDCENFYRELTWLCLHQHVAFNSPVWFNVGLYHEYKVEGAKCNWCWNEEAHEAVQPENPYEFPQASACFIQSVEDNMEAIMGLAASEALLFKFGSGTGTDLSTLRSCREKLSGGGKPSGPLSFMRVYDQIAAVVKSGGKTRRAAKMQSLKVWHPDIMEFIDCKYREEEKARILVREGLCYDDAYSSILFQNANLSVRVTDDFMTAVKKDKPWATHWVTNPSLEGPVYQAREVFDKISKTAWACGDPGLQYDTTINRWHTCPESGRINASNPCSEYMFLDNSACNLASVNLMRFRREGGYFDYDAFVAACRIVFIAQEILVDNASYPIKKIAENSHKYRPLGLGYSNLGCLLMSLGLPYDSDEARGLCSAVTALLQGAACRTSAELAAVKGPFEAFEPNRKSMNKVMEMHWEQVNHIKNAPRYLKRAAQELWDDVLTIGPKNGYRNAQATVLAPTGTISFMMDCDTTGIEPDIALVKFKQLAGGGTLHIVNRTVPLALETLGYGAEAVKSVIQYIDENHTIEGAPELLPEHLPVFDCAFPARGRNRCIPWQAHVKMMAAAQPFISGAISKTVNMPSNATVEDVAAAYMMGWELGLKALAIYRDGSKAAQPLSTSEHKTEEKKTEAAVTVKEEGRRKRRAVGAPRRERLPDTRHSVTHKFNVGGHEGYITVGLYPDGRVGELFITMAKEGSTIGGLMDCFSTALSMSLQYGVPLSVYVDKFSHTRFEPLGFTKNPDIPTAKSLVDYIFRWLGSNFLPKQESDAIQEAGTVAEQGLYGMGDPLAAAQAQTASVAGSVASAPASVAPVSLVARRGVNGVKVPRTTDRSSSDFAPDMATSSREVPERKPVEQGVADTSEVVSEEKNVYRMEGNHSTDAPYFAQEPGIQGNNDMFTPVYNAESEDIDALNQEHSRLQSDAPACDNCGAICVRSGNCYLCYNCGRSLGCS